MPTEKTALRIGAVQMRSGKSRSENLEAAGKLLDRARDQGAELIALPENFSFLSGDGDKLAVAETIADGDSVAFLQAYARKHRISLIGGSVPLRSAESGKVSNTSLAIDSTGAIVARYDKIHLFDIALDAETTFAESAFVERGTSVVVADVAGIRAGMTVCYDLRFPELYRALSAAGAQVLFVPAAFTLQTGRDHWEVLLRARAIENLSYVVASAQQGRHTDGRVTYGRTMIIGPWGQILAQAQDGPGVVVCDVDLEYLNDVRRKLPCLEHIRRDVFGR
jgi:nitrilase